MAIQILVAYNIMCPLIVTYMIQAFMAIHILIVMLDGYLIVLEITVQRYDFQHKTIPPRRLV
jgi:hypothetical protein